MPKFFSRLLKINNNIKIFEKFEECDDFSIILTIAGIFEECEDFEE
jgi:hypothetical protein